MESARGECGEKIFSRCVVPFTDIVRWQASPFGSEERSTRAAHTRSDTFSAALWKTSMRRENAFLLHFFMTNNVALCEICFVSNPRPLRPSPFIVCSNLRFLKWKFLYHSFVLFAPFKWLTQKIVLKKPLVVLRLCDEGCKKKFSSAYMYRTDEKRK